MLVCPMSKGPVTSKCREQVSVTGTFSKRTLYMQALKHMRRNMLPQKHIANFHHVQLVFNDF